MIEKESASQFELLDKICEVCGKPLYKQYEILGRKRILPVMCDCRVEKFNKLKQEDDAKEKQIQLEALIKNSLMDEQFKTSTFENWNFSKGSRGMYELGKRYANNFKECKKKGLGLLIYGDPGNGKTYLSSCIANELLKQFVSAICVSINGLLMRIQETYSKFGKEAETDIIKGLYNADLLILDDLGTENKTPWSKSTIYNIIDSRYRSKLPLIITTNLDVNPKQTNGILTRLYDRRTEDRILEMCVPMQNTGKSIRLEEAKVNTNLLNEVLYKEGLSL